MVISKSTRTFYSTEADNSSLIFSPHSSPALPRLHALLRGWGRHSSRLCRTRCKLSLATCFFSRVATRDTGLPCLIHRHEPRETRRVVCKSASSICIVTKWFYYSRIPCFLFSFSRKIDEWEGNCKWSNAFGIAIRLLLECQFEKRSTCFVEQRIMLPVTSDRIYFESRLRIEFSETKHTFVE